MFCKNNGSKLASQTKMGKV